MPITSEQLANGVHYQRESYAAGDPIDQISQNRQLLKWLIANKEESIYGNGIFNEKVRFKYDSNFQRYTGDDQVTYNRRDTVRKAPFQHYEAHDGFSLNETELADNGIIITDDRNAVMTDAEKTQIVNKVKEAHAVLKEGMQYNLAMDCYRDGSQSTLAPPGLELLVSKTPSSTTVGGLSGANAWWQNNVETGISISNAGDLVKKMETEWRNCTRYGGMAPDAIFCGSAFFDAYRGDSLDTINRQLNISGRGGANVDASVSGVFFKGVPVIWDPMLDEMDSVLSTTTRAKTCYFLNSKTIKLRPNKGRWMVNRKPSRMYDRYTHFFATTADYGLTINKRNANAVLALT